MTIDDLIEQAEALMQDYRARGLPIDALCARIRRDALKDAKEVAGPPPMALLREVAHQAWMAHALSGIDEPPTIGWIDRLIAGAKIVSAYNPPKDQS